MSASEGLDGKQILLIGEFLYATAAWDSLSALGRLRQLNDGDRDSFLQDCRSGVYDGIDAIARTFDSVKLTGRFDPELVEALPKSLKFVSHNGAGYDQIDVEACTKRGISVSNTPGAVDASTANTALYLLLGALRHAHVPSTALRAGQWRGAMDLGHDPEGKTLGILGMGGIGGALARRAAPFDMKIQYHNRRRVAPEKNPTGAEYVSLEHLLATSDVISVHLPLSDRTRHFIGREEISMMKDGVVIVNTARGPIIDEEALVEALESGKVFGAGLDVFEREPEIHEGLIRNNNTVLLPHTGTATYETMHKMESLVADNVRSALKSGRLLTPVPEQQECSCFDKCVRE